jgi:hypothetical protein
MNTRLSILNLTSAALLLTLVWTGSAAAQQSATTMPEPKVDRSSCEDINWHRDLLRQFPWVVEGCQEAITVGQQKWARFEAEFLNNHGDGSISSDFRNDRGRTLGRVRLMPTPGQLVQLDGRDYRFSDLMRGQVLNFYVPEDRYAFATSPGASADELVQIIEAPPEPTTTQSPRRMARVEPARTQRPDVLPATAGMLPMLALGGMLSLLGGIGLTARRRSRAA